MQRMLTGLSLALLVVMTGGCLEEYDAPPAVDLNLPSTGTFFVGDTLELTFSEEIKPNSLKIRVWSGERTLDQDLVNTTPLLDKCSVDKGCSSDVEFTLNDDGKSATIVLPSDGLGQPDVPLVLEILEGLEDQGGTATGTALWYDFQFKPDGTGPSEDPIEFEDGIYILVGQISDPLPATLRIFLDMKVQETGEIAMVGAEANVIGTAPVNTNNPDELHIDETDTGFVIHQTGWVRLNNDERFMETDPTPVTIKIGPLSIILADVRITGKIEPHTDGHDIIRGTLSFSGVTLDSGNGPLEYDGGNCTVTAEYVEREEVQGGMPALCTDLCGGVPSQCDPPAGFPDASFCE